MAKTFKSEGIVFRSIKYSESSIILDIYSKEVGLNSYIISGVRKVKSKISNVFSPMNIINFVAYSSENKLSRIKEAGFAHVYQDLNQNVIKSSLAMFLIDLSRNAILEKETNLSLYTFIKSHLLSLDHGLDNIKFYPIIYSIQFAAELGFQVNNNFDEENKYFDLMNGNFISNDIRHQYIMDENLSRNLNQILNGDFSTAINKEDRNLILDKLMIYFKLHLEGFRDLKSLPVIRSILS